MIGKSDILYLLMSRKPWHSLPQPFYNDPDIFDADLRSIWHRDWIFAAPSAELPRTGSYITLELGPASVIVVRGADGIIRAFHNSCRHRGSRICAAHRGTAPKLVCPYHHGRNRQSRGLGGCDIEHSAISSGPPTAGTDPLCAPYAHGI